MEQGMDPELKKFFLRIMYTISWGIFWLGAFVAAGLYFRLAWDNQQPLIARILFYVGAVTSLFFLLRYYYRIWKN